MLSWVQAATSHPAPFRKATGHPRDLLLPTGPIWQCPEVPYYDLWCQIMVRAIIAVRHPYDLDELIKLDNPIAANLNGSLVTFEASLKGRVEPPAKWETAPISTTLLTRESDEAILARAIEDQNPLRSDTAAEALSEGTCNGVLIIRNINSSRRRNGKRVVRFDAIPLIIGSGVLTFGDITLSDNN